MQLRLIFALLPYVSKYIYENCTRTREREIEREASSLFRLKLVAANVVVVYLYVDGLAKLGRNEVETIINFDRLLVARISTTAAAAAGIAQVSDPTLKSGKFVCCWISDQRRGRSRHLIPVFEFTSLAQVE